MPSVKRCPQCLSADIVYEAGYETGQKYHCKKCGYIGALILEEDYEVDDTSKK